MDYTVGKYRELCKALVAAGYRSRTVQDFAGMGDAPLDARLVILRHDVDRFAACALPLAEAEAACGLTASYYFRVPATLDARVIAAVSRSGHEVGLHYECLDKAKGDPAKAAEWLERDLQALRKLAPVRTVSMHGNPLTRYDNRDLWNSYDLARFGLTAEVYLSIDFQRVLYYSDTGRTWLDGRYNIKDVIPAQGGPLPQKPRVAATDDLIGLLRTERRNLYLLVHPERWRRSLGGWALSLALDVAANGLKVVFKALRRARRGRA